MSDFVRVRSNRNMPQFGLQAGDEGDVPTEAAQPYITAGWFTVVEPDRPARKSRTKTTDTDETGTDDGDGGGDGD